MKSGSKKFLEPTSTEQSVKYLAEANN